MQKSSAAVPDYMDTIYSVPPLRTLGLSLEKPGDYLVCFIRDEVSCSVKETREQELLIDYDVLLIEKNTKTEGNKKSKMRLLQPCRLSVSKGMLANRGDYFESTLVIVI